jgi:prophage regulatory protein
VNLLTVRIALVYIASTLSDAEAPMRRVINKKTVAAMVGYHPEHLMRLVREGRFPRPFKLGDTKGSAVRWYEDAIDAWIAEKAGASQGEAA